MTTIYAAMVDGRFRISLQPIKKAAEIFPEITGEVLNSPEVKELKTFFEFCIDEAIAKKFGDKASWCWDGRCTWRCLLDPKVPHAYVYVKTPDDEDERRVFIYRSSSSFCVDEDS
jgi:hypothetical protein